MELGASDYEDTVDKGARRSRCGGVVCQRLPTRPSCPSRRYQYDIGRRTGAAQPMFIDKRLLLSKPFLILERDASIRVVMVLALKRELSKLGPKHENMIGGLRR